MPGLQRGAETQQQKIRVAQSLGTCHGHQLLSLLHCGFLRPTLRIGEGRLVWETSGKDISFRIKTTWLFDLGKVT